MSTSRTKKKEYAKPLVDKLPRSITSDKEHAQMVEMLTPLMMRHLRLSGEERKLLRSLVRLIADYEEDRFTMHKEPVPPLEMLEFMMDNHDHTARDLWDVIGDKGTISKILSGQRSISKAQAKRLGKFYHVSSGLFI